MLSENGSYLVNGAGSLTRHALLWVYDAAFYSLNPANKEFGILYRILCSSFEIPIYQYPKNLKYWDPEKPMNRRDQSHLFWNQQYIHCNYPT